MSGTLVGVEIDITDSDTWPELLTIDQAAMIAQVSRVTMRELIASGELDSIELGPRTIRIYKRNFISGSGQEPASSPSTPTL